jgi:hypothetical protein
MNRAALEPEIYERNPIDKTMLDNEREAGKENVAKKMLSGAS